MGNTGLNSVYIFTSYLHKINPYPANVENIVTS